METAGAFAEELTCAVCLQIYQNPVVLPCQHSFCLKCIDNVWGFSGVPGGVSCPQCRRLFNPRPCLEKNFTLRNIVEKYSQSQTTHAESAPVMCEYCIENPSPAVKTCLKCETSFCSLHLKPHLTKKTYNDHTLIEPTADLTKRQCLDHKKILEFYCEKDEKCVCISCTVIGMHKSHTLLSLDQAEAKIKDKLKKKTAKIHRVQKNCTTEQQDLKKSEAEIKTLTNELKGKLSKEFSEWRKQLEEDEKYALKLIDDAECRALSQIRIGSESLTKKMEQITLIDAEIQKQLQMDCLSFIQDSKQLFSRISQFEETMVPSDVNAVQERYLPYADGFEPTFVNSVGERYNQIDDNSASSFGNSGPQKYVPYPGGFEPYFVNPDRKRKRQTKNAKKASKSSFATTTSNHDRARVTSTQNITLDLSRVCQLIKKRVTESQTHLSSILNIIEQRELKTSTAAPTFGPRWWQSSDEEDD